MWYFRLREEWGLYLVGEGRCPKAPLRSEDAGMGQQRHSGEIAWGRHRLTGLKPV